MIVASQAKFYYFKHRSGKWMYEGTGVSPRYAWETTRDTIMEDNNGKMPGLSGRATDLTVVIIPLDNDSDVVPMILRAEDTND